MVPLKRSVGSVDSAVSNSVVVPSWIPLPVESAYVGLRFDLLTTWHNGTHITKLYPGTPTPWSGHQLEQRMNHHQVAEIFTFANFFYQ